MADACRLWGQPAGPTRDSLGNNTEVDRKGEWALHGVNRSGAYLAGRADGEPGRNVLRGTYDQRMHGRPGGASAHNRSYAH